MSKTVEDVMHRVSELLDSEDPLSYKEAYELYLLSMQLGAYQVYNQNGWEYDFE